MTPMGLVVWGMLLVAVDLRIDTFDVLPDPVGWLLVVVGALALRSHSRWFGLVVLAGSLGVMISAPQVLGPLDSTPFELASTLAETVVVFGMCSGIRDAISQDQGIRTTAHRIRVADLLLVALLMALVLAGPDLAPVLLVAVLATLGVFVWFCVFLLGHRRHPELQGGRPVPA